MSVHSWTLDVDFGDPPTWTEIALWTLLVALAGADAATTTFALAVGLPEANPLLRPLMHAYGPLAVIPVKLGYAALAAVVWRAVDRRRAVVLAVAVVLEGIVVLNNAIWITLVGW